MGVTIHFEGQLKSEGDYNSLIIKAQEFTSANDMEFSLFEESTKHLSRVKNEQDWDYEGYVRGIKIQPHENSDPLWLEFDENNYVQDYCKTQFAGIEVHIEIIKFFKKIESHFHELLIIDEGEFWETADEEILQTHFNNCLQAINEAIAENKKLSGPFRMEDGRIIDVME